MNLRTFFNKATPSLAIVAAIVASILIGISPIFVRLSEVGPIATAFYRLFLAIPFLLTWTMYDNVKGKEARFPSKPQEYFWLMTAGVFFALDLVCWHWAITMTSVMHASLLNNMTTVFVTGFAWLIFGARPTKSLSLGIICALVGACVLTLQGSGEAGGESVSGDFLALLSAVFFSGYILIAKHLRSLFTVPTIMAWSAFSTLYTLALVSAFESEAFFPATVQGWLLLGALAVVVHVGGQGLLAYSMRHLSAAFSSLTLLVGPIAAILLAWWLFEEVPTGGQLFGGGIILSGIIVACLMERKQIYPS
ncbi:MAG: DMT family transporter [bacterium]|nr:DMT family transporter [bacterium]